MQAVASRSPHSNRSPLNNIYVDVLLFFSGSLRQFRSSLAQDIVWSSIDTPNVGTHSSSLCRTCHKASMEYASESGTVRR